MGYHYSADFVLRVPESATVAMSLDVDRLHGELASNRHAWDLPAGFMGNHGIISGLLNALDFDVNESWTETALTPDGSNGTITVYTGSVNTKLNTMVDIVLHWMATHGVGMDIDCRGEDDTLWRWSSEPFTSTLRNDTLVTITETELARYQAAEAVISRLNDIAEATPAFPLADALAQENRAVTSR